MKNIYIIILSIYFDYVIVRQEIPETSPSDHHDENNVDINVDLASKSPSATISTDYIRNVVNQILHSTPLPSSSSVSSGVFPKQQKNLEAKQQQMLPPANSLPLYNTTGTAATKQAEPGQETGKDSIKEIMEKLRENESRKESETTNSLLGGLLTRQSYGGGVHDDHDVVSHLVSDLTRAIDRQQMSSETQHITHTMADMMMNTLLLTGHPMEHLGGGAWGAYPAQNVDPNDIAERAARIFYKGVHEK